MKPAQLIACVGLGAAWGALAYMIGAKAFGATIWAGVALGPLIGGSVGVLMQHRFQQTGWRWLTALGTLYVSASAFGLAAGVYELWTHPGNRPFEMIWSGVAMTLYGTTLFVLFLWPLAYGTHLLVEYIGNRRGRSAVGG